MSVHIQLATSEPCPSGDDPAEYWVVVDRECNYSRFNGNRYTPSRYSAVKCLVCGWRWRTRAAYVARLRDATHEERTS